MATERIDLNNIDNQLDAKITVY